MNRLHQALICITCLLSFNAFAGIGGGPKDITALYNPNPEKGDIELPMPNNMKMVLRAVAVRSDSSIPFLFDKKIKLGIRNLEENEKEDRSFYESSIDSYIGAALKYEDLPKTWANKIPENLRKDYQFYFIGKYELTNGQWNAVMGEPQTNDGKEDYPKTNISWYDIQVFLQKYNEWLLSNHHDDIPVIEKTPTYLRLPTEAEWEYAARGGILNPEQEQYDFILNNKDVNDYAVFRGANATLEGPARIGSRLPNLINLYDTSGNVAELIQGGFRYSVTESIANLNSNYRYQRLHGSEGGLIAKGGSYQSVSERDVYPGKRIEMKMFDLCDDGSYQAHKLSTLGARLVLSSINIPGPRRNNEIISENKKLLTKSLSKNDDKKNGSLDTNKKEKTLVAKNIKDSKVNIDPHGDPFVELNRIYNATSSPIVRDNLKKYEDVLKDMASALYKERVENLSRDIKAAVFKVDVINNIMQRFYDVNSRYYQMLDVYQKTDSVMDDETYNGFIEIMKDRYHEMDMASNSYKNSLEELATYSEDIVTRLIQQINNEYQGEDKYNQRYQRRIQCLVNHLDYTRKQGGRTGSLSNEKIWNDFKFEYEDFYKYLENFKKVL